MKKFDRRSEINNWYLSRRAGGVEPNSLQVAIRRATMGFDTDGDLRVHGELGFIFDVFIDHERYVCVREHRPHPSGGREVVSVTRVARRSKAAHRFAKAERSRAMQRAGQMRGWYAPHVGVSS